MIDPKITLTIDFDNVARIELYKPEKKNVFVHIDFFRDQPIQVREMYWRGQMIVSEWITTTVVTTQDVDSRTTWNDGVNHVIGYEEKWDHPISTIASKLEAYFRNGYKIAKIRYIDEYEDAR